MTGEELATARTTRYCDCLHGVAEGTVPHAEACIFWDEQTDADRMVREQVTSLMSRAGDHQAQAEHWHKKGANTLAAMHGAEASAYRRAANGLRDAHLVMLHTHTAFSVL